MIWHDIPSLNYISMKYSKTIIFFRLEIQKKFTMYRQNDNLIIFSSTYIKKLKPLIFLRSSSKLLYGVVKFSTYRNKPRFQKYNNYIFIFRRWKLKFLFQFKYRVIYNHFLSKFDLCVFDSPLKSFSIN